MKRTADNFLPSSDYGNVLNLAIVSDDSSQVGTNLLSLPEDVILRIFATYSESTLRQLSSVCTAFCVLAKNDILWQNIADSILFPPEIASKPADKSYKEYCKEWLSLTKGGILSREEQECRKLIESFCNRGFHFDKLLDPENLIEPEKLMSLLDPANLAKLGALPYTLQPRNPHFIHSMKQMNLSDYKLLSPAESQALNNKEDTLKLMNAVCKDKDPLSFHHVAQQQVGETKFDFLNCTPYVVSFDSERNMLINNKLTSQNFNSNDCQLIILVSDDHFSYFERDIGHNTINCWYCDINDLNLDDLTKIPWELKGVN